MALDYLTKMSKLQKGINKKFDEKILINKTQFFSKQANKPITMYVIKKARYDAERDRMISDELFSTTSQIQAVLYLRDYWYKLNGYELPTDNAMWNEIREKIDESQN